MDGAVQIVLQLLFILLMIQVHQQGSDRGRHSGDGRDKADKKREFGSLFLCPFPKNALTFSRSLGIIVVIAIIYISFLEVSAQ